MRKRTVLTVVLILALTATAAAQDLTHKVELSVGGAFQAWTETVDDYSQSYYYFNVPIRAGYFFTRDFELEAEGIVALYDEDFSGDSGGLWAMIASANALYNFYIVRNPHVRPFVLAGFGITNIYYPPYANAVLTSGEASTRTVFNLGAGMKTLLGDRAAFRVEYRYQRFPQDETEWLTGWNVHSIQMGASLFL